MQEIVNFYFYCLNLLSSYSSSYYRCCSYRRLCGISWYSSHRCCNYCSNIWAYNYNYRRQWWFFISRKSTGCLAICIACFESCKENCTKIITMLPISTYRRSYPSHYHSKACGRLIHNNMVHISIVLA